MTVFHVHGAPVIMSAMGLRFHQQRRLTCHHACTVMIQMLNTVHSAGRKRAGAAARIGSGEGMRSVHKNP